MSLTYEQAVEGLKRAVRLKGPDYVYDPDERAGGPRFCVYFHEGQPSCIVGHVLAEHGFGPELDTMEDEGGNTGIHLLINEGFVSVADTRTGSLLSLAQSLQDRQISWGEAVERAIEATGGPE